MEETTGYREQEDTINTILKTIPDILYVLDRDGRFSSFSYAEDQAFPADHTNEFTGKYLTDVFEAKVAESFMTAIDRTLRDGHFALEYELIDKSKKYFSAKFSKLNKEETVCLVRDITEQRESELALQENEEKYHNLINNINEVIYEIDERGIATYISPSIERLSGYKPDEIIGKNISIFTDETNDDREVRMKQLFEEKETKNEYRLTGKDGQERWIRFSTKVIIEDGILKGGTGTLIDVTEKKHKEIELQKNEEKYRLLAENIADVIWVLNLNQNRYTYISPSVSQLRGYSAEEAIRQQINETMVPESATKTGKLIQSRLEVFMKNPTEVKTYYDELQQTCKDGSIVWVETNTHFQLNENGETEVLGVSRNIEKRKQAEQQLKRYADELKLSEEKFSGVFKLNPVAMALGEPKSDLIIDINDQFTKTLGFSREEIIGKNVIKLGLFPLVNQQEKIQRLLSERTLVNDFETTVKSKSGNLHHFLISSNNIKINQKEFWLTSAVNVTDIKEKENKIRYLLNQQKLIADISRLFTLHVNISSVLDNVLRLIGNHTGASRVSIFEDLPGGNTSRKTKEWCNDGIRSMKDISHDSLQSWKKLLAGEGHLISNDMKDLPGDVSHWLESQDIKSILVYPIIVEHVLQGCICLDECKKHKIWSADEEDLIKTVSVIISNALERKRNLELLANSELRLKLAIDSAKEGIWDWNMETGKITLSESFYLTSGYAHGEIPPDQESWEKLIHPDDIKSIREILNKTIDPEMDYFEIIYRLKRKDGSWMWVLDHGKIIEWNRKKQPVRSIGTRIDITEQKLSEQKYNELLKTQDKLFTIIANNLRGPIGSFSQGLDMLTGSRVLEDNVKNKLLGELNKASRTTFNLLENLLTLSRSQTGSLRIEPQEFKIKDLIERNVDLIMEYANEKDIRVLAKTDDDLIAFADKNSIDLVLRNLLSNAVKFTPFSGTIEVSATATGSFLELIVTDNGVGIKEDIIKNLFSSNSYGSSFGTNKEKGTGIGLTLCNDLMEKNDGSISVESREGKGSRFIIYIPNKQGN